MTSAVSATFQPISPASWHPNAGPRSGGDASQWGARGEEGQARGLWAEGPAVSRQRPRRGCGGAGGGGRAPGGRCRRRRRHSAAMERPRAAADGLSRGPYGLGLLLLLGLPLLPRAALGQDRLDAPPPPAAPLSRWGGPVGVSWGLRAAAPGGPFPRGRWRRSAQDPDRDCGRIPDFVSRLVNNTHQVRGAGPGRRPDWEVPPPPPFPPHRASPPGGPRSRPRSSGGRGPAPERPGDAAVFRHRGGRRAFTAFFPPSCQTSGRGALPSCKQPAPGRAVRGGRGTGAPEELAGKLGCAEPKLCPLGQHSEVGTVFGNPRAEVRQPSLFAEGKEWGDRMYVTSLPNAVSLTFHGGIGL